MAGERLIPDTGYLLPIQFPRDHQFFRSAGILYDFHSAVFRNGIRIILTGILSRFRRISGFFLSSLDDKGDIVLLAELLGIAAGNSGYGQIGGAARKGV